MLKWSILSFCEVKNRLIMQILFDKNSNFHNKGSFKIFELIKIIALELDLNNWYDKNFNQKSDYNYGLQGLSSQRFFCSDVIDDLN